MKLSIITINYGNTEPLVETIRSVDKQTCVIYEHLIVASGITDQAAADLQRCYGGEFRRFIFNKDKSLYNAMNIGIAEVRGDCMLFLNAGDCMYDDNVLERIGEHWEPSTCLVFRTAQQWLDTTYLRPGRHRLQDLRVSPGHQGFIAPLGAEKILYDESRVISADHYWMQENLRRYPAKVFDTVIAKFSLGGISNYPSLKSIRLRRKSDGDARAGVETIKLALRAVLGAEKYYDILARLKGYEKLKSTDTSPLAD